MEDFGSGGGIAVLGADYDVPTAGKGLDGQAFPCFASHQDGLTDGLPFEVFQIFAQVPQEGVSVADYVVGGFGYDEFYHGFGCLVIWIRGL